jgi:hypothetical protein
VDINQIFFSNNLTFGEENSITSHQELTIEKSKLSFDIKSRIKLHKEFEVSLANTRIFDTMN